MMMQKFGFMKIFASLILTLVLAIGTHAQCDTWLGSSKQEDAENAHVIYRQFVKNKDYAGAFAQWKIAFDIAPAADGKRDWHFKDGIEIYKDFFSKEADAAKKKEYADKVIGLYEQLAECVRAQTVTYKGCSDDACLNMRIGQLKGRQAFDMYYTLLRPRAQTFAVLQESVELAGNDSEYIILKPYADILVYLFQKNEMSAADVREHHQTLLDIADYNIANNATYKAYYDQAKASMQGSIAQIENDVYDCAYFVDKLQPDYDSDPTGVENLKRIIVTLKRQGCVAGEPFLDKVEAEYAVIAAEFNAAQQAEFEANNPSVVAKKLYDEEDWNGAIEKYKEAIEKEPDASKKATYYFSIASIQFRKLDAYNAARASAREAASLREGWGRPFMLIGDMYAKSSRTCGNDAYSRGLAVLAALDKWSYAKSIDESVAAEANRNIARFSQYMPPQDDAFMMGKLEGATETVGCWIGESVRLRFN